MIQPPFKHIIPFIVVLGASFSMLTACDNNSEVNAAAPHISPFANPHAGEQLARSCHECHGNDGVSQSVGVPHLAGQNQTYLRDALLDYQSGKRQHDTMQEIARGLSEKQMIDLAAWYSDQALAKNNKPITQAALPQSRKTAPATAILEGRRLSKACADCHGSKGNSPVPGIPNLTGQHPDFLNAAIKDCRIRNDEELPDPTRGMSADNLADIALFYAIQGPKPSVTRSLGNPDSAADQAKKCTLCHGKNGNSKKKDIPSLAGQDAAYLSKAIRAYVDGDRPDTVMTEAVSKLNELDIDDLAAWFAQQTPEMAPRIQIPLSAGQWSEKCDSCHGSNGNGLGNAAPRIAGQREEYIRSSLQAYQDETRGNPNMHGLSVTLTQREINDLAAYYSAR